MPDSGVSVRLVYFAWVRERVGRSEEVVELPAEVTTVAELLAWLGRRGEGYAEAFAGANVVRAALDQVHAKPGASLAGAREVALFPPMTGG